MNEDEEEDDDVDIPRRHNKQVELNIVEREATSDEVTELPSLDEHFYF